MRKLKNNNPGYKRIQGVIRDFVINQINDIDSLACKYELTRGQVSTIINNYVKKNQFFIVVPSLDLANTYFAFNQINERKFTVDIAGFIQERYMFNGLERKKLEYLGFNI